MDEESLLFKVLFQKIPEFDVNHEKFNRM